METARASLHPPGPLCIEGGVSRGRLGQIVTHRTRHPGRSIRPRLLSRPATGSSSDPMPFPSRPRVARFPAAVARAILGNLPQLPAVSRPTILAVLYRRLGPGNLTVPAPRRALHHFIRSHARELHIVQSLGFLSGRFPGGRTVTLRKAHQEAPEPLTISVQCDRSATTPSDPRCTCKSSR